MRKSQKVFFGILTEDSTQHLQLRLAASGFNLLHCRRIPNVISVCLFVCFLIALIFAKGPHQFACRICQICIPLIDSSQQDPGEMLLKRI